MSHEKSHQTHCPDCTLGTFTRNHYFTGKLLVERDFTDEQRFHIDKLRHHHQRLHGWGVVCGLKVKQHPDEACRDRFVVIEPGTAIDCCGHEILLREEVRFPFAQDADLKALRDKNDNKPHTFQICIKYKECPSEEIPVLFDECGCDDTRCAPNRILESYELDLKLVDPTLTSIDPEDVSLEWTNTTPLAHSTRLALHDATQRLYVMSSDTPAVIHAVSTTNHEVISALTRTLPKAGLALAASNDGTRLYAAVPSGADINILVLDANDATAAPIQTLVVAGASGAGVALAVASDGRLYATIENTDEVVRWGLDINAAGTPAAAEAVSFSPVNIRGLSLSTTRAYTADAADHKVVTVDIGATPAAAAADVTLDPAAAPSLLAIAHSTAGDMLVVGDETNNTLYLVTLDGTNTVKSTGLTHKPVAMAVSPGGNSIYILERDGATPEGFYIEPVNVHRVQLSQSQPLGSLTQVGDNAADLALSESGRTLYVPYNGDPAVADSGGVAIIDVTEENCAEFLWQGLDACPSCDTGNCVMLATIESYHIDDKLQTSRTRRLIPLRTLRPTLRGSTTERIASSCRARRY